MKKYSAILLCILLLQGCAAQQSFVGEIEDPEGEVNRLIELELAYIQSGNYCHRDPQSALNECDGVTRRLTQLFTRFPDFERLQLALAISNHGRKKNREAQYYVDRLLAQDRPRPEAAILGARLAMEEGNTRRAETLLQAQRRLNPMHAGLQETLAAVFYLNHQPEKGFAALASAEQLGAPDWRVAYHRGLLYELSNNAAAACEQYAKSFTINPIFALPEGRILGLTDNPTCLNLARFIGGA
ncbi:hypothetical protein MIH18_15490 [Marinobacter sp. M3C]|jgi:tetratricopeptide (TPR) repeat protein|uniref:hypothetical protein n=1 Tax=unclassified Marinobacter TaxID=83889 RepID=UPI00200FCE08|nr:MULTISPECIES: hypothetical protein [unclassified Marinobacter]MCL1478298.1 hypothetical protein [Marinobacter sp.]MCL1480253.1 hypothetical protein [Marinobacter sp.]MCL1483875.1 hypothetical protein [Marinobacter sp.]MCL1487273.1 hypothetical protein [Marinobacter sp.]UQG55538.1 hypothetical protein MIH16_19445 [Marinobacter sp. M4C]